MTYADILNRVCAISGMSLRKAAILDSLDSSREPVPQSTIQSLSGVTAPQVSTILQAMVADGWIERVRDPGGDRRKQSYQLTPCGKKILLNL
jgi:DNA-binding MarR family transcriptional regulator